MPVAIGLRLGADQAGSYQAWHGLGELGLGQDGVVDAVGLRDYVTERAAISRAASLD